MNRTVTALMLAAVLGAAGGCEEKKAPPASDTPVPQAADVFDKGKLPKGAKKTGPGGS